MAETRFDDPLATRILTRHGEALAEALAAERHAGWTWFEPFLSYDNARLPEALMRAGAALGRRQWIAAGLDALGWLSERQRAPEGHFRPVGNAGFGVHHALPAIFDQQPLEVWATVDACETAFTLTGDRGWIALAANAWRWFDGENDGRVAIADPASGESFDGLQADGHNRNRGAESVLAFQLANRTIRTLLER